MLVGLGPLPWRRDQRNHCVNSPSPGSVGDEIRKDMQLTLELPVVNPYAAPPILCIMTRETPIGCRRTRLMKPEVLAKTLGSALNSQEKLLLVDSRSFLEYNVDHIQHAINITGSKLVKRRLQHNKVSLARGLYLQLS